MNVIDNGQKWLPGAQYVAKLHKKACFAVETLAACMARELKYTASQQASMVGMQTVLHSLPCMAGSEDSHA